MSLGPEYYPRSNSWAVRGTILEPVAEISDGVWHDLEGFWPVTVTVEGVLVDGVATFAATWQVCVSNKMTQPLPAEHGSPFGSVGSDNGGNRSFDGPYRWVKVRVLSYTSGTMTAHAFGYRIGGQQPG